MPSEWMVSPVTRYMTVSAILVAWSPIRSMFLEQNRRCAQKENVARIPRLATPHDMQNAPIPEGGPR